MTKTCLAYIGLGSNLDSPLVQVTSACKELSQLPQSQLVARSHLYHSRPLGPQDQPDYINAAVCIRTTLHAEALLDALQQIEQAHQRVRQQHWGPRTLDLDLLLYGSATIATPRLTVPHPQLAERNFVLQPLLDIAPDLALPDGRKLSAILHIIGSNGLAQVASP